MMAGLPLAGVKAIVEGLSSFQGDIRKMNSSLKSLQPGTTFLQRAFSSAWDMVKGFGREVLNVAEYALGHLLADALQTIVSKLGELISATIEAGSEFQTLELRLQRLNLNALISSGENFNSAQKRAVELTKEQLGWLQKLAVLTPYDAQDISRTYTLARSYGFADDRARSLTESITNFASGMGLGSTEIERIIVNFGQLVQQGKINSRELTDLARGSFVPVNDILELTRKKLGLTNEEFQKMQKTGKLTGSAVQTFIASFEELVKIRFEGAAEDMAKTFKAASDNALDVVKSIGGLHVVKPILDEIGERIAGLVSAFADDPEQWDRLVNAAKRVGEEMAGIVGDLLDLLPGSESISDSAVSAIEGIADWLDEHGPGVKLFFRELGDIVGGVAEKINRVLSGGPKPEGESDKGLSFYRGIMPGQENPMEAPIAPLGQGFLDIVQKIADFINNTLIPAFIKIQVWFEVNKPLIDEFWSTVWEIIGEVISDIFGGPKKEGGKDVLTLITEFMQYVIDNQKEIVLWVEVLWTLFVVWQVLSTLFAIVIGIIMAVAGAVLGLISVIIGLIAVFTGPTLLILGVVIATIAILVKTWIELGDKIRNFVNIAAVLIDRFAQDAKKKFEGWMEAVKNINWIKLGADIIAGIAAGVSNGAGKLISVAKTAAMSAYNAVKEMLGISSPSKLFMKLGEFTMEGFAEGIEQAAEMAARAMKSAVGQVAMPVISSMAAAQAGATSITNNRTAELNVYTSAPREPILQDFAMLESLMGA